MATNFPEYRAWTNTSKAIRQCQIADKALQEGRQSLASDHYSRALRYLLRARRFFAAAETVTERQTGSLFASGAAELEKALGEYASGYAHSGRMHYANALEMFDAALEQID